MCMMDLEADNIVSWWLYTFWLNSLQLLSLFYNPMHCDVSKQNGQAAEEEFKALTWRSLLLKSRSDCRYCQKFRRPLLYKRRSVECFVKITTSSGNGCSRSKEAQRWRIVGIE
ncbi:unnamed protein product [Lathyrus sativus]|nr:unnamed protein product [Lathyrus sativus]